MRTEFLTPSQAQLKKWARLDEGKVRDEEGLFPAEGVKVVEELLKSDWLIKELLVLSEKSKYWEKLSIPPTIPVYQLNRSQWGKIGQDKEPEGVIAVVARPKAPKLSGWLARAAGPVLMLHEINNPLNLGALLRCALWFGFDTVVLSAGCVDFTNPKAVRASMGSLFHLTMIPNVDFKTVLPELKKKFKLIGSDVREGVAPRPAGKNVALMLGNESHGLPQAILELADEKWNIPGSGKAESLSLPQAAAIMMYECTKG